MRESAEFLDVKEMPIRGQLKATYRLAILTIRSSRIFVTNFISGRVPKKLRLSNMIPSRFRFRTLVLVFLTPERLLLVRFFMRDRTAGSNTPLSDRPTELLSIEQLY
ncbi:hypothetical protein [Candidatus Binatus sp.]|uniref:hypothetical protein n=1 Tax=Candidatus Binatus sp. TaxID=2811406 RepID=UPI003C4630BE